jgi:hypothetical protein
MIGRTARRRLLVGLVVLIAVALVAGTDGWIIRHFGAHAASDKGPDSYLNAIACPTASTCWAVGQNATARGGNIASERRSQLIEHEVAGSWHKVGAPAVAEENPALTAITCPAARDCWAVGGSSTHGSAIIEHWTGGSWQLVRSPRLAGAQLESVACASPDLCWAAGGKQNRRNMTRNVLEQWDGTSWRIVTTLADGLKPRLFSCPISGHCLILGLRNSAAAAARFDLGRWTAVAAPSGLPPGRLPAFLACSALRNCLALQRGHGGMITQEWNGRSWTAAVASMPRYPAGLACSGNQGCWLLGASGSLRPVAARWQGNHWVAMPVGSGAAAGYLGDLACGSTCWAVGGKSSRLGDGSFYSRPLIAPVVQP